MAILLFAGTSKDSGISDQFKTYLNDASDFIAEHVPRPAQGSGERRVLLAHSMGGQIALRYVMENPALKILSALSSPLVGLHSDWFVDLKYLNAPIRGSR